MCVDFVGILSWILQWIFWCRSALQDPLRKFTAKTMTRSTLPKWKFITMNVLQKRQCWQFTVTELCLFQVKCGARPKGLSWYQTEGNSWMKGQRLARSTPRETHGKTCLAERVFCSSFLRFRWYHKRSFFHPPTPQSVDYLSDLRCEREVLGKEVRILDLGPDRNNQRGTFGLGRGWVQDPHIRFFIWDGMFDSCLVTKGESKAMLVLAATSLPLIVRVGSDNRGSQPRNLASTASQARPERTRNWARKKINMNNFGGGRCPGTNGTCPWYKQRCSLGQTGRFLLNWTVASPFGPVLGRVGFVPGTIVPRRASEDYLCWTESSWNRRATLGTNPGTGF